MYNNADKVYIDYMIKHKTGLHDTFNNILKPILIEQGIDESDLSSINTLLSKHDESKYESLEWSAYRDHFYDPENNPRSHDTTYNHAWNHHQKSNPHHWQYWVLINDVDEPQLEPLEMPFVYVIEMLCDWHSAGKHYNNTAYDWYTQQKEKMILHPNTRELVEKYIEYLR